MRVRINKEYKSLIANKEFELPDFCILTGKNGSGKSHLLSSFVQDNVTQVFIGEEQISTNRIKYIQFNGLNPNIKSDCNKQSITEKISQFWNSFIQQKNRLHSNSSSVDQKISYIYNNWNNFVGNKELVDSYKIALENISKRLKKNILDLTEDDVRQNIDVSDLDVKDTFSGEFATIFKAYQIAYDENQYKIFKNQKNGSSLPVYSDEEFFNLYGPKPWIFINKILKAAGLPYEVNNPEDTDRDSTFHFVLKNPVLGIQIQPTDLSTGEKVLMSLAMAIYNSAEKSIKNKVLLIDEPDAALHPEFSHFLIETIKNYIVKDAGVNVIITTHSPTTVALETKIIYLK